MHFACNKYSWHVRAAYIEQKKKTNNENEYQFIGSIYMLGQRGNGDDRKKTPTDIDRTRVRKTRKFHLIYVHISYFQAVQINRLISEAAA